MKDSKCGGRKSGGMNDVKPIKRAMGGVAKIRHGQSTPQGSPKSMRRGRVMGDN